MNKSQIINGAIKPYKLLRMPKGSTCIYEISLDAENSFQYFSGSASNIGAKVTINLINGFDGSGNHRRFLTVKVLKSGKPLKDFSK